MSTGKEFSPEVKSGAALESLTQHNGTEICGRLNITPNMLTRWEHEVVANAATIFRQSNVAQERIRNLTLILGRILAERELEALDTFPTTVRYKKTVHPADSPVMQN